MPAIRSPRARTILVLSFVLLVLLAVLFFVRSSTSAASPGTIDASKKVLPAATATPAASCWLKLSSPNPANSSSQLLGVTAISTDDVWAVGYSTINSNTSTLIEHWNGTSWSTVPSPNPGTSSNSLDAVDSLAANDVWAVGSTDNLPLALHWDGAHWSVVPVPIPPAAGALGSVAVISANDVWAVVLHANMMLRWDGTRWSIVGTPQNAYLSSVDGTAPDDVWAVGQNTAIHWNGTRWSTNIVPVPAECEYGIFSLNSVSARSPNDVWAVGGCPERGPNTLLLAAHWNGSWWTLETLSSGAMLPQLLSIDAIAANDVWTVGYGYGTGSPDQVTIVKHWDGVQWADVPAYDPGNKNNNFFDVAVLPGDEVWAVGSYDNYPVQTSRSQTLIERYYATCPPPPCPGEQFVDVCPGDYFYTATLALANDGILSGYSTSPPCQNNVWVPCFKPYNSSTRGQISKVVSLAAGFNEPVTGQRFQDVPPGSTFYTYTERMAERDIVAGYPCGGSYKPCIPPDNLPYFLTNNNVTRGQLSKMVSLAFEWNEPVTGQSFQDVPAGSTFYDYIGRLYGRGIVNGYPCGGAGEPCVPPDNRPYFRPNGDVTRGQTAKIVQLARTQSIATPTPMPTAVVTATATSIATVTPTQTPTNPDCQGIPPSQYMQISPGNCGPVGTTFTFLGTGFQPNEGVQYWLTTPDGVVLGTGITIPADENGNVGPFPLDTTPFPMTGVWSLTFYGLASTHEAIGYFMVLPPEERKK